MGKAKTIWLRDETYNRLEQFRDKRETFSEAVERLLELPRRIRDLANILEGQVAFQEKGNKGGT